ncbi:putative phage membrane protein [Aliivibrio wodanis]|uniref:Putative phage membrane protein n=1 Tax=Aliivibrio wodanis TaxID=80852 RepID=A0A090I6J3_9GAMM|nr:putative phage membrane protein [Aliivibrio wodanis]
MRAFLNSLLNKAERIHYLVLSIALISGGFWTWTTFDILNQKEAAQKQLESTNKNLEKAKLELTELKAKIDGTDSSFIKIETNVTKLESGKFGLIVNVLVQNTGTNDVNMLWDKSPISIHKMANKTSDIVVSEKALYPKIYRYSSGAKTYLKNLFLFVGAKKELSFYVELEKEGLYYIIFEAKTDKELSDKVNNKTGGKNGLWFSSKYIYVKDKK